MKIEIERKRLLNALESVKHIKSKQVRATEYALIKVTDKVILLATDLESYIDIDIEPISIIDPGSIMLHISSALKIIKAIDSDIITILQDNGIDDVIIETQDNDRISMIPVNPDDFPQNRNDGTVVATIKTPKKSFLDRLSDLLTIKTPTDNRRPHITGVQFQFSGNELKLTSTDGKRAYQAAIDITCPQNIEPFLIPKKELKELKNTLKYTISDNILIEISDNYISIECDNVYHKITILEGNFPDLDSIFSSKIQLKFSIEKKQIVGAVKRVLAIDKACNSIYIDINQDQIEFEAQFESGATYSKKIEIEYAGEKREFCFNPLYLFDILKLAGDKMLDIKITENNGPAIIADAIKNTTFLIMPQRRR